MWGCPSCETTREDPCTARSHFLLSALVWDVSAQSTLEGLGSSPGPIASQLHTLVVFFFFFLVF